MSPASSTSSLSNSSFPITTIIIMLMTTMVMSTSSFVAAEDLDHDPYSCSLADAVNTILNIQERNYYHSTALFNLNLNNNNNNNKHKKHQKQKVSNNNNQKTPEIGRYENDMFWAMSLSGSSTARGLPCLEIRAGWWSYEMCFGRYIRQFHEEPNNPSVPQNDRIVHSEYILGLGAESVTGLLSREKEEKNSNSNNNKKDYIIANRPIRYADGVHTLQRKVPRLESIPQKDRNILMSSSKFRCTRGLDRHMVSQRRMRPHSQGGARAVTFGYKLGTVCDLTKKHREVDVVLVCEREEILIDWNITEAPARPCHYTSFIFGRAVCSLLKQGGLDGSPVQYPQQHKNEEAQIPQQQESSTDADDEQDGADAAESSPVFTEDAKQKSRVKLARIIGQDEVNRLTDAEIVERLQTDERQLRHQLKQQQQQQQQKEASSETTLKPSRHDGNNNNNNNNNNNQKSDDDNDATLEHAKKIFEKVLNEQSSKKQTTSTTSKTKTNTATGDDRRSDAAVLVEEGGNQNQISSSSSSSSIGIPTHPQQQPQFPPLTKDQEEYFQESMMFST